MFSEIINTFCVLFSFSLLFLGATTHKCVKQVEEKIDLIINEINELNSDSDSDSGSDSNSDSYLDSNSDSYLDAESDSDSDISSRYDETFRFEPFTDKSLSLSDFKDDLILKKTNSW